MHAFVDDLEYVYVPAALALFNHVIAGIKSVQSQIDQAIRDLRSGSTGIVSRFPRGATVYPLIETLGASTDLVVRVMKNAKWSARSTACSFVIAV